MDSQGSGNQGWGHQQNVGYISPKDVPVEGNQQFNPNQDVTIVSALDQNLVLDVSQDSATKNKLILWKKHGTKNQRFRVSNQNGKFVLMNFSGGVVGVPNSSSKKGEEIYVHQPTYGAN